jgi:nicotinamidase-related amidase
MQISDFVSPHRDRTALLTIDVQTDFCTVGAPGEVVGTAALLPRMVTVLKAFRAAGRPVIHVVRLFKPDGSNVDASRRSSFDSGQRVVVFGSAGAELAQELKPSPGFALEPDVLLGGSLQQWEPNEWCMYKPRWSAFFETPLERHLRALQVDTVAVMGCNFPNSPRASLYDAGQRDYRLILVEDAVSNCGVDHVREAKRIGVTPTAAMKFGRWLTGDSDEI